MKRLSIGLIAGLLVLVLVAGAIVPVAGASQADDAGNESAENDEIEEATVEEEDVDRNLDIDDLRDGGQSLEEAPPSVRVDGQRMWWMEHWPSDALGSDVGSIDDASSEYVARGATVDRNAVYLRTVSTTHDVEERTVVVAYWNEGEREVERNESVVTEPVAEDVVVDKHSVSFGAGMPIMEVPLRQSDEPRQVTMWLENDPDVRWTFEHESVATTQEVSFSTYGGLLEWSLGWLIGPFAVGSIGALVGAKGVVRRTGVGTQWGFIPWIGAFVIGAGLITIAFYGDLANLVVQMPLALSAFVVALIFVLALETFDHGVRKVRFVRTDLHGTTSPNGEKAVDHMRESERTLTVIDRDDEPLAVATPGLLPFLSRLFGSGAATLKTIHPEHEDADETGETDTVVDPLQTRVSVGEGDVDEKVFVHRESPKIADYDAEGWSFDLSLEDSDRTSLAAKVAVVGSIAMTAYFLAGPGLATLAGGAGLVSLALRPVDGHARVWPAPVHYRAARDTALHLAESSADADTFEEQQRKLVESQMQPVERAFDLLRHSSEGHAAELDSIYGEYQDHDPADSDESDQADSQPRKGAADD